jgi:hypothetical protein
MRLADEIGSQLTETVQPITVSHIELNLSILRAFLGGDIKTQPRRANLRRLSKVQLVDSDWKRFSTDNSIHITVSS